jgi:acyl-CoA dehydrogenase
MPLTLVLLILLAAAVAVFAVRPLRMRLLTAAIFKGFRAALPSMSETERVALEAGTVWWEADLFRGRPNWKGLSAIARPQLTAEERLGLHQAERFFGHDHSQGLWR